MDKVYCAECGEELITDEELESGLCITHLAPYEAQLEAELEAEWEAEELREERERENRLKQPLQPATSVPAPIPQPPQSLNALRDRFEREEIELSTAMTLRFPDGHEQQVLLCVWPATADDGGRGAMVASLWFEHLAERDELGEVAIQCPDGEDAWTLDKVVTMFGINPDAPIWDVDEDI